MLGVKYDVYLAGIMFLKLLSGTPAMVLTHHIDWSIEMGMFEPMLDPSVLDWPVEEAWNFAKLALQCRELRWRDRPDLGNIVMFYCIEWNNWLNLSANDQRYNSEFIVMIEWVSSGCKGLWSLSLYSFLLTRPGTILCSYRKPLICLHRDFNLNISHIKSKPIQVVYTL